MLCTYTLITVPSVLFLTYVAPRMPLPVFVIGMLSFVVAICAFSSAACSDPGIVFRDPPAADGGEGGGGAAAHKDLRYCTPCDLYRPKEAYHCYDCELCVVELDHHCPWTGKCIGKRNLQFFYFFLIALTVHTLYVVVASIAYYSILRD
jgi:palmitoyltransferase ZDHHC9/14/18